MSDLPEEAATLRDECIAGARSRSLAYYLDNVKIDGATGPVRFGQVAEPWQLRSTQPILAAIEGIAGIAPYQGKRFFWRDLPQGHDKTSSIARLLNGALAFCRKPLRVGVFAKDSDQANRIWQFARDEARLNPWLGRRLQFVQKKIRGIRLPTIYQEEVGGGEVTIYDSDYEGNAGHKLDVTICEELTWWPEKAERLFDQLYTRRHKIAGSVFVILGNAGLERTWQHRRMLEYRQDPEWDYYRTAGSVAGWIPAAKLARDRRSVVPSIARRLYDNEWVAEDEQTYLTRTEVEACLARARILGLHPLDRAEPGVKYVLTVDYGPKKDRTALCIVGLYPDGSVRVVKLDVLQGKNFPGHTVPLALVRTWVETQYKAFASPAIILDPYQTEQLAQEMEGKRVLHRWEYRGGMRNYQMAEHVRTLVVNKTLLWPEDIGSVLIEDEAGRTIRHTLADEFLDLVTRDMPYGYRWDHKANRHDDRCVAVGMGAFFANKIDPSRPFGKTGLIPVLDVKQTAEERMQAPTKRFEIWGGCEG